MGRESHGHDPTLVHSSIALLQERFRQLQRVKEMREERELLRMVTSESKQLISNSKTSMMTNFNELPPSSTTTMSPFSYPALMMTRTPPSPPPPPPLLPPHSHVSLSLWPSSSSSHGPPSRETLTPSVATFLEPETPLVSMTLWRNNAYDCVVSDSDSGVDTSLHL